jgi:TRAP-type C4-dicarboxylate transport system substrate-binding protein
MRLALASWLLLPSAALAQTTEIRVATLAPPGSAWAKIMDQGNARLVAATQGRVKLRPYFGGQQGDERDVVRKMKLGQLDGAALTATGLGLIVPDVLVLQLPFMFDRYQQIDFVRQELSPELEQKFAEAGYVLVSWGDVGWVHTYSTEKLDTPARLAAARMWQWGDDPIVREYFSILGINGVPMGVPDVLPALQTGTIQACYGPPLAAVALQWYTKLRYMTDRPSAYGIGAFVIRQAVFDALSPADRKAFLEGGRATGAALVASVRRDNERAKKAMQKSGIQVVPVPDAAYAVLRAAGREVWHRLAGQLYSKELLERVIETAARAPR